MAFDFKKAYKALYMPQNVPELITVPPANYIAVRGHGDPNEEGGAYKQAIEILYSVAYTLKMSYKTEHQIEGFFEYVVPPLEGFWWQEGTDSADYTNKSAFNWISVLRLPAFGRYLRERFWTKNRTLQEGFSSGEGRSILVQDKGPQSQAPAARPQSPAVRGFPRF